ncbi:hypothetical protein RAE13_10160 [Corynebacterium curieae]|uniref:Uncharacterized protein n=1 Tax=Corynebacterium curieae TaxID=2913500 RepID=A0ABU3WAL1_9CORY|nr:hypothetical protein [Corynebacterium curieae]MDV2424767.1 hypothetical protein [Corynebacterium curieae]
MKKLLANNPYTPRLQDPPPSKLPCSQDDLARPASEYGGVYFYPLSVEEQQLMFYGKET